jgi:mRNA-degrading endonuclease RelE of RelBE toxin-antitoxin system
MDIRIPRILGNLTGDGNISNRENRIVYINESLQLVNEFKQNMNIVYGVKFNKTTYIKRDHVYWTQVKNKILHGLMKDYFQNKTLHHECRIPSIIREGTNKAKREYIKYLYGDDGSVFINGRGQPQIVFNSTSKQLVEDVCNILNEKGIQAKPKTLSHHNKYRGRRLQYAILLLSQNNINLFQKHFGFSKNSFHKTRLAKQKMLDCFSYFYKVKPQNTYF